MPAFTVGMDDLRYSHIIAAAVASPWAIREEKLAVIASLLTDRIHGVRRSDDEIAEVVGARKPTTPQGDGGVAVIPIYGTIVPRGNLLMRSSGGTSAEELRNTINAAASRPDISAIVLDIDSPGGNVEGITEAASAIEAATQVKPVVAVANHEAASAAFWLASMATEFVASPSAVVGSVGVVMLHEDVSAALEKQGVGLQIIRAGRYKAEGLGTALDADALANRQALVNSIYQTMIADIARGRGVARKTVSEGFGEGRVLLASDALEAGMVDGIETFESVLGRLTSRTRRASAPRAESSSPIIAALSDRLRMDAVAAQVAAVAARKES